MGCESLFFIVSLIVIIITLDYYVGVKPKFYIQQLYVPAFNNSHTYNASNLNSSIIIDFKFKTPTPLRYKDINITLYYGLNNRSFSVGSYVIPGFNQGRMMKTVRRRAVVEARVLPWEDAFRKISGGSTVALAVELATKYQLKRYCKHHSYYTRKRAAVVAADVEVDGSGAAVTNKPIWLH